MQRFGSRQPALENEDGNGVCVTKVTPLGTKLAGPVSPL